MRATLVGARWNSFRAPCGDASTPPLGVLGVSGGGVAEFSARRPSLSREFQAGSPFRIVNPSPDFPLIASASAFASAPERRWRWLVTVAGRAPLARTPRLLRTAEGARSRRLGVVGDNSRRVLVACFVRAGHCASVRGFTPPRHDPSRRWTETRRAASNEFRKRARARKRRKAERCLEAELRPGEGVSWITANHAPHSSCEGLTGADSFRMVAVPCRRGRLSGEA